MLKAALSASRVGESHMKVVDVTRNIFRKKGFVQLRGNVFAIFIDAIF